MSDHRRPLKNRLAEALKSPPDPNARIGHPKYFPCRRVYTPEHVDLAGLHVWITDCNTPSPVGDKLMNGLVPVGKEITVTVPLVPTFALTVAPVVVTSDGLM